MRRYLSITLMLICGFAQTSPALSPSTQDEIIDEEYAVYAALFGENRKVAVIQTSEYRDTSELWEEIKREEATKNSFSKIGFSNSLSQSTIRDYNARCGQEKSAIRNPQSAIENARKTNHPLSGRGPRPRGQGHQLRQSD